MKYVNISPSETLRTLTEKVGFQNVDQILADNGLQRLPNIGSQLVSKVQEAIQTEPEVSATRKISILNQFAEHSDIYATASLADSTTWKVISKLNTFPDYLYVNPSISDTIPNTYGTLGNNISVDQSIRDQVNGFITAQPPESVDPSIFGEFSSIQDVNLLARYGSNSRSTNSSSAANPMSWFKMPTQDISLYSSLTGESINIPVYPEEMSDSRTANYTQMPDLLYQYEPWQMYQSSGPRSNTYEFHMHRDMWTGDHTDGKANELIRFCQAQCYPLYNGSAVIAPTVTLYIAGSALITGVMNEVRVEWAGPIGHDGFYLEFTLLLTITEVSPTALDHTSVMSKSLIG